MVAGPVFGRNLGARTLQYPATSRNNAQYPFLVFQGVKKSKSLMRKGDPRLLISGSKAKAGRARFDTLAAESMEFPVFPAVLTAATQDGDMAAAKLLIDRVIPSRRGAPVSFHIRPLKTPEDCAAPTCSTTSALGRPHAGGGADHLSHRR